MISRERMERALRYLAESDDTFASAKADALQAEKKAKAVRAAVILTTDGTGPVKEATAESSEPYQKALEEQFDAVRVLEGIRNKRDTESTVIDVWRSLNAARNKGQIT